MKQDSIDKLLKVWASNNTITKPVNKKDITDMVEQVAGLFAPSSYFYLIMNFEKQDFDFVGQGVTDVLGLEPDKLNIENILV